MLQQLLSEKPRGGSNRCLVNRVARSSSRQITQVWYGFKKGLLGRFGSYLPPVLESLGLAEVEHNARNNRMRAI